MVGRKAHCLLACFCHFKVVPAFTLEVSKPKIKTVITRKLYIVLSNAGMGSKCWWKKRSTILFFICKIGYDKFKCVIHWKTESYVKSIIILITIRDKHTNKRNTFKLWFIPLPYQNCSRHCQPLVNLMFPSWHTCSEYCSWNSYKKNYN